MNPFGGGKRQVELRLNAANYAAVVREKAYVIETFERSKHYLLGRIKGENRQILLHGLTEKWLRQHFKLDHAQDSHRVSIESSKEEAISSVTFDHHSDEDDTTGFVQFHWDRDVLSAHRLPDVGYPVPLASFQDIISGSVEADFAHLLYWLQIYTSEEEVDWLAYCEAMRRLTELVTTQPAQEIMTVQTDDWWLEVGPVDLSKGIVTVQRQERLVAALQPREDGRLRVAVYSPLDGRAIDLLAGMGVRPSDDGSVCMRRNNWEYALDGSAGMGQVYASEAGRCYLSLWEFGLGVSSDGSLIDEWHVQRNLPPISQNYVVKQMGVYALLKLAYESS
ncbi:hypothetical protein GCM10007053_01340 [Halioglobus pacificus]|uniref:Uncharacterized protein n=1 Tax=Parahalioglobus pacificus TaxID=930806 RepID=A0A918XCC4_9GAMM|nr:hypothetical protein GCM10007053_01340 [Halioglobus pacificus]